MRPCAHRTRIRRPNSDAWPTGLAEACVRQETQGRQTACTVVPSLSHTLAGCPRQPLTPAAVSRWSKIGRIDHPRQYMCTHRCDRKPKAGNQPAPSSHRSPRLTDCARYRTESACRDRPEHPSTLMSAADFASSLTDQWKHAETGGADQPRGACGTKARTRTGASGDARGCGQSRRLPI